MAQEKPPQEEHQKVTGDGERYWSFGNLVDDETWQQLLECRAAMDNPVTLNRLVINSPSRLA